MQEPYLGPQADIWGLGIILYMLVCYDHPFEGHDENDTLIRIMDVKYVRASCRLRPLSLV